jgi:hypothetical protein
MRHHIQKSILYDLAFRDEARFSELKDGDIENKLFTYHLKQLINDNLVEKTEDGSYRLSAEGRRQAVSIYDSRDKTATKARSVVFVAIRRKGDGAWLLYRRNTHPLKDLSGFMHITPDYSFQTIQEQIKHDVRAKTNIDVSPIYIGSGFFRMLRGELLESFTHFSLFLAEHVEDTLESHDERADYFWVVDPDFSDTNMLPNMQILTNKMQDASTFFIDELFRL